MALKFLYLINAVLITRGFLYYSDVKVRFWKALIACFFQELATMVFLQGQEVNQLRIAICLFNLFAWLIEFGGKNATGRRLAILGLYVFSFGYFFSPNSAIQVNPIFREYINRYQNWGLWHNLWVIAG